MSGSLKVWQRSILTYISADTPPAPRWGANGHPFCTTACPHHSGLRRCAISEMMTETLCIPAVEAMARLLNEGET